MKFLLFLISFIPVFFPLALKGQEGKDTVYRNAPERLLLEKHFLRHSIHSLPSFGDVHLRYDTQSGNLHRAQHPYSSHKAVFYARGGNQLGKFKVSGEFYFDKQWEDSLSYALQHNLDYDRPFQYYAGKAGQYERQNYRAQLTLSHHMTKHFRPLLHLNYLYHWTTGSVDPRVESKVFRLEYKPGVEFSSGSWKWALLGHLGRGNEKVGLTYKNRNFQSSLQFPERIHYLNMGYGYSSIKDTLQTRKYQDLIGLETHFAYQKNQHAFAWVMQYHQERENNSNDIKSNTVYHTRNRYHTSTFATEAHWLYKANQSTHLLYIQAGFTQGYDGMIDFSPDLSKVNYQFTQHNQQLHYIWRKASSKHKAWTTALKVDHHYLQKQDHAVQVDVQNQWLHWQPSFQLQWKTHPQDEWCVAIHPGFRHAIRHHMTFSENALNDFIRQVVMVDHRYFAMSVMQWGGQIQWQTKRISAEDVIGIYVGFQHEKSLKPFQMTESMRQIAHRNALQLGIQLYL
jgi:hypothetical protein